MSKLKSFMLQVLYAILSLPPSTVHEDKVVFLGDDNQPSD